MKKIVSVLLASAMVLSLAACNANDNGSGKSGRDRETAGDSKPAWSLETYPEISEAEPETSETTTEATTTTSETTTAAPASQYGVVTDYVFDLVDSYKDYGKDYHVPYVNIVSDYTSQMNEEIDAIFKYYDEIIERDGYCHYTETNYLAYLSSDGIISIVFVENGEWDDNKYHVWNIDCVTGSKVDNRTVADYAGITDITATAKDACHLFINNRGGLTVENYELVSPDADHLRTAVEDTFSSERINDDMMMGLTGDGTPFFVSGVVSLGGAEWYYEVYDINGYNMNNAEGWVN